MCDTEKLNHQGRSTKNPWLYKHGHRFKDNSSATYRSWASMKRRCSDENNPNYGGAGITVCERWDVFENFLEDMGERPKGTTIDRINPDGHYSPSNCRWATNKEQAINRKVTTIVELNGERDTLNNFAKKYGIPQTTIYRRYKQGLRGTDLIERRNRNHLRCGQKAPSAKLSSQDVALIKSLINRGVGVSEIARRFGVKQPTISDIKAGRTWGSACN